MLKDVISEKLGIYADIKRKESKVTTQKSGERALTA